MVETCAAEDAKEVVVLASENENATCVPKKRNIDVTKEKFEEAGKQKARKVEKSFLEVIGKKAKPERKKDMSQSPFSVQTSLFSNKCDTMLEKGYHAAKARGLKIFSPEDIKRAKPSNKPYLEFWNDKTIALANDPKYAKYQRLAMEGVVIASWTKRKVVLLREEARQLEMEIEDLKGSSTKDEKDLPSMKNVAKNINRMMVARNAIDVADAEVQKLNEEIQQCFNKDLNAKLRKDLQSAMARVEGGYTELKKTQDALRKSLKSDKAKLSKLKEQLQMQSLEDYEPPQVLTVEEEDELAADIEKETDFLPE